MRFSFQTGTTWRARATVRWNTSPTISTDNFLRISDGTNDVLTGYPIRAPKPSSTNVIYTASLQFLSATTLHFEEYTGSPLVYDGIQTESPTKLRVTIPAAAMPGDFILVVSFGASGSFSTLFGVAEGLSFTDYSSGAFSIQGRFVAAGEAGRTVSATKNASAGSGHIYHFRGVDRTNPVVVSGSSSSSGPGTATLPANNPDYGAAQDSFFITVGSGGNTFTAGIAIQGTPTGYTGTIAHAVTTALGGSDTATVSYKGPVAVATEDPSDLSIVGGALIWADFTILVRSAGVGLRVRTNYRAIQPPALDNAETLYAHAINIVGGGTTVIAPLLTDTDTLYSATIKVTLKPVLLSNSQAFFNATIRRTVKPTNLVNTSSFFAPTIRVTVKPVLLTNTQTFFSPKLVSTVKPTNLVNTNTLLAHTIRGTVKPVLLTNTQTFFNAKIIDTLKPPLLTDVDTLYAHKITATVKPAILTDADTLYSHKITAALKPGLFTDPDTFYSHTIFITGGNIIPPLLSDGDTFYSAKIVSTVKPTNLVNANNLRAQTILVTVKAPLLTNTSSFFSAKIIDVVKPVVLTNTNTLRAHTISISGGPVTVVAPLIVNTNTLRAHTILTTPQITQTGIFGGEIRPAKRREFDTAKNREEAFRRVRGVLWTDLAAPALTNRAKLHSHGVVMHTRAAEFSPDLGLSPLEIDEITDILDALEAMEALEAINHISE